ncbi:hypothetical protein, partial [Cupriavidus oxalaticus]|uniref:hypothetical protein n=1 Tax=Cupriavidus oxalaticus TaxID=96344 RepID=UPI003178A928
TLDLAILWRLHRVQPGRLNTMKSASGGHFCFAKTGHYRFAATSLIRIMYIMLNHCRSLLGQGAPHPANRESLRTRQPDPGGPAALRCKMPTAAETP